MSGWQPIKTAPKDGTRVMLWCHYRDELGGSIEIARYAPSSRQPGPFGQFIWRCDRDGGLIAEKVPTYWRPLPKPPAPVDETKR